MNSDIVLNLAFSIGSFALVPAGPELMIPLIIARNGKAEKSY